MSSVRWSSVMIRPLKCNTMNKGTVRHYCQMVHQTRITIAAYRGWHPIVAMTLRTLSPKPLEKVALSDKLSSDTQLLSHQESHLPHPTPQIHADFDAVLMSVLQYFTPTTKLLRLQWAFSPIIPLPSPRENPISCKCTDLSRIQDLTWSPNLSTSKYGLLL